MIRDEQFSSFCARFVTRELDGVTILRIGDKLESADADLLVSVAERMINAGKRGFICDLSEFDPSAGEKVGDNTVANLFSCYSRVVRLGGVISWLHAGAWYGRLKVISPPPNFGTEREAIFDVVAALKRFDDRRH